MKINLPPRETWEAGNTKAEEVAEKILQTWEAEQKIAVNESGMPTQQEVQLSVSVLVLRRQVAELKGDLMNTAIYASRFRTALMMNAESISEKDKQVAMQALGNIEGKGRKIAEGWMLLERALTLWMNQDFWKPGVNPWVEAKQVWLRIKRGI